MFVNNGEQRWRATTNQSLATREFSEDALSPVLVRLSGATASYYSLVVLPPFQNLYHAKLGVAAEDTVIHAEPSIHQDFRVNHLTNQFAILLNHR